MTEKNGWDVKHQLKQTDETLSSGISFVWYRLSMTETCWFGREASTQANKQDSRRDSLLIGTFSA